MTSAIRLLLAVTVIAAPCVSAAATDGAAMGSTRVSGAWPSTPYLSATYAGWIGPTQDPDRNPHQRVHLATHLTGTIDGRPVSGDFVDDTIHYRFDSELAFQGRGRLTIGSRTGKAELRIVTAPLEYVLRWTGTHRGSRSVLP